MMASSSIETLIQHRIGALRLGSGSDGCKDEIGLHEGQLQLVAAHSHTVQSRTSRKDGVWFHVTDLTGDHDIDPDHAVTTNSAESNITSQAFSDDTSTTDPIFTLFPHLPPELRLKIWSLTFTPRTLELHTRRYHYADASNPKWQSLSRNPAQLSVNWEARHAALQHYSVAIPLATPLARGLTFERPGDQIDGGERVLYLNLESDTVVVLGELSFDRLRKLLAYFRSLDPVHRVGLRKLALSTAGWAHQSAGRMLRAFGDTLFGDLDEFVLFLYGERMPPERWMGGRVELREMGQSEESWRFEARQGSQFRDGRGWIRVGRNEMRVRDLWFLEGW